jgi:hypothetical protein
MLEQDEEFNAFLMVDTKLYKTAAAMSAATLMQE